jgi:hypothetical protein
LRIKNNIENEATGISINIPNEDSYKRYLRLIRKISAIVAIGKCTPLDIRHDVSAELLQYYLNEFNYKFNRIYFGDKLIDWALPLSHIELI